ncbi:porin [Diaphorobacter caeni]|uniref:porin n=1 Tax=Diaphorobacter caeni TaxID=2784387 RepID=UPI0018900E03|nr:porin [Diaphorobacter caeni]MBF5003886.1 porin [Diaphorobacter caeni]
MTLKIIATALTAGLLAPTAFAQSQVSIYGVVDEYVGTVRTANDKGPATSTQVVNSGGMTTSFIGFKGSENLGGGLKTVFGIESFIRLDTGVYGRNDADSFWGRLAIVGLSSDQWGTLTVGRHVTPYALATGNFSPLTGSTTFSPSFATVFKGNVQGDTRHNNSLRYVTPKMGGLVVDALYSFGAEINDGPNAKQARSVDAVIRYEGDRWAAAVGTRQINLNANDNGRKQKSYMAGLSYDFTVAQIYAQVHDGRETFRSNPNLEVKRRVYELSGAVPLGAGRITAAYAYSSIDDRNPATPDQRRVWSVGYMYALSKRTDLYAVTYRDLQRNVLIEQRILAAGVRHRF